MQEERAELAVHPCFGDRGHFLYGRIHLPVAPKCNISCRYCDRKFDCANESRPGVTSAVMDPLSAAERAEAVFREHPYMKVAGVAGPGEPLYNEETFSTLSMIRERVPDAVLCLSSNGLLVPERLRDIISVGVSALTVTVNCLDAGMAAEIYDDVFTGAGPGGRTERFGAFLEAQKRGVALAAEAGIAVKVNTVLIPGINDGVIGDIARTVSCLGAYIMNIMPLIPCGKMSGSMPPDREMLSLGRKEAGRYMRILSVCSQCRADACGIPGGKDSCL